MRYSFNDGGRALAGYRGKRAGDCIPRAIAIALNLPYRALRSEMDTLVQTMTGGLKRSCNNGTPTPVGHKYLTDRGWEVVRTPGQYLEELPGSGEYIVVLSGHWVAVTGGMLFDTWDSRFSRRTKNGSPKMEGYYQNQNEDK